jgi:hypothetical protein
MLPSRCTFANRILLHSVSKYQANYNQSAVEALQNISFLRGVLSGFLSLFVVVYLKKNKEKAMKSKFLRTKKANQSVNPSNRQIKKQTLIERFSENRGLAVLSILIILTFGISSIAAWRVSTNDGDSLNGVNSSGATVVGTPPVMPANAPGKEYVYAGSSLISTVEAFRQAPNDLAVWRPSSGTWLILNSQQQLVSQSWGTGTDKPAPGDFDGDGKTDFCVYRPSNGTWYIINSSNGANQFITFGTSEDLPAVADFDGDGKADITVWRPSNQTWYVLRSSNSALISQAFGSSGDKPVPADFDGDGRADYAVWRNSSATFWVNKSTDNQATSYSIGASGDEPVVGDYDGDGKTDYAARRTSDNIWRIRYSASGTIDSINWGLASDKAVPGRYNDSGDSDSKTDIAVWRPSNGVWYIRRSSDGSLRATAWGQNGDIPVPSNWRR